MSAEMESGAPAGMLVRPRLRIDDRAWTLRIDDRAWTFVLAPDAGRVVLCRGSGRPGCTSKGKQQGGEGMEGL